MTPKEAVKQYESACWDVALAFMAKYYKGVECDYWWVANEVGECLHVNDSYWNMDVMHTALKINAPVGKLFDWYEHSTDPNADKINLIHFCKRKKNVH